MGVKLTGKQLKAFMASDWGNDDAYWDDVCFIVNDVEIDPYAGFEESETADDDAIEVISGTVYLGEKEIDAMKFLRQWLKKQTHVSVTTDVPREQEAAFRKYVAAFNSP